MRTLPSSLLIICLLFPSTVASAAALYDGKEQYVQAGLEANFNLEIETAATTSVQKEDTSTSSVVATDAELHLFEKKLQDADPQLERAEVNDEGEVRVFYYHDARLFGMFPMKAKSETTVALNKNGMLRVTTHMPWWSVLATGTGAISSSVDSSLANSGEIITNMKLSGDARAKARVLEAVVVAHQNAALSVAAR